VGLTLEAIRVMSKVLLRGRSLQLLALALVVPVAISTSLSLTVLALEEQSRILIKPYEGKPAVMAFNNPPKVGDCVSVYITSALVHTQRGVLMTQVNIVDNVEEYARVLGVRMSKPPGANAILSAGATLGAEYGLRPGSPTTICVGGTCVDGVVTSNHYGLGLLNYALVTNDGRLKEGGGEYLICRVPDNEILKGVVSALNNDVRNFIEFLQASILLPYALILYLALSKVAVAIKDEGEVLLGLGLSVGVVRRAFVASCLLLGIALVINGMALGTFLTHVALWSMRFFGKVLTARPLPSLETIALFMFVYAMGLSSFGYLASKRIKLS